jgi:hypothetical protein
MTTTYAVNNKENIRQSQAKRHAFAPPFGEAPTQFVDNNSNVMARGEMQKTAFSSQRMLPLNRFQEMADNSTQVKRLEVFQLMANNASDLRTVQLKNNVPLKDKGEAKRTSGSETELRLAVSTTISSKILIDIDDTATALEKSIINRKKAPEIGLESTPGGHTHRIEVEEELLGNLKTASETLKKEAREKSMALANEKLKEMPNLNLQRGPTGKAWGKS